MIDCLIICAAVALSSPSDALRHADGAIRARDPGALAVAVHPITIVYSVDGGKVRAESTYGWKARLKSAADAGPDHRSSIEEIDAGRDFAIARLTNGSGGSAIVLLARIDDRWRIVSKVVTASRSIAPGESDEVRSVVSAKLASDRAWDATLFTRTIDARALVLTVEDRELVAASVPEWIERYRNRKSSAPFEFTSTISATETIGDIGWAKWSLTGKTGPTYTDRALFVRTDGKWRMIALSFSDGG